MPEFINVDPGELHLPPTRAQGADPYKLARQIAKHGDALDGMPHCKWCAAKTGSSESTTVSHVRHEQPSCGREHWFLQNSFRTYQTLMSPACPR
jgi:hypothetical protein